MATEGKLMGIPAGQYKLVAVAVDLTGNKLIDEICHIGAYYQPETLYSQYILPHREVSRASVRTHGIRTATHLKVLKDVQSDKTLKSKTEFSALKTFLTWLKKAKGASDGVILAFHDNNRNLLTPFLMEALDRYKVAGVADEFFNIVKGFVNVGQYAGKVVKPPNHVTLRALCRRYLSPEELQEKEKEKSDFLKSATDRAKYTYAIILKMSKAENEIVIEDLLEYGSSRDDEAKNLEFQRELAEKVRTLKPIFSTQVVKGRKERSRAVVLRRHLIKGSIDYECLSKAYEAEDKAGIHNVVSNTAAKTRKKDVEELVEIVYRFFKTKANEAGAGDASTNRTKEEGDSMSTSS